MKTAVEWLVEKLTNGHYLDEGMTPKEKAKELVSKFNFEHTGDKYILHQTVKESKRCALIAVDEIMYNNIMEHPQHSTIYAPHKNDYWQQVRQEIINL